MVKHKVNRKLQFFLTILLVIVIDQLAKFLSTSLTGKVVVIPKLLWFNFVSNTGAAFGIFPNSQYVLGLVNVIVAIFIVKYFLDKQTKSWLPLAFIVGGAIGNAIDRFFLPGVIDFIDLGWWPVFNFADAFIVVGVVWLIFNEFRKKK